MAYVAQEAWVRNETLEMNVLFGKSRDEKQYNAVLDACALRQDLDQLPAGDKTEIGEKVNKIYYNSQVIVILLAGPVIDTAPGARFITKFISLAQVVPGPV